MSQWLPLRTYGRHIHHSIVGWKRDHPGTDPRWEPECGSIDPIRVEERAGELYCVACLKIAGEPPRI